MPTKPRALSGAPGAGDFRLDDAVDELESLDDNKGLACRALSLRQLRRPSLRFAALAAVATDCPDVGLLDIGLPG